MVVKVCAGVDMHYGANQSARSLERLLQQETHVDGGNCPTRDYGDDRGPAWVSNVVRGLYYCDTSTKGSDTARSLSEQGGVCRGLGMR